MIPVYKPLSQENQAIAHHQIGMLHQHFGHYDLALDHYNRSIKISKKREDDKGDYDAALEQMGEEAFLAVLKEMGVTMAELADKE
jgi:hypothetical protein